MPNIKSDILDSLRILFKNHGVTSVQGTYEYPDGTLTFNFADGDVKTQTFKYKGDGQGSYSLSGFKSLLSDVGGLIIKDYNQKYLPDYLADFMEEVTE